MREFKIPGKAQAKQRPRMGRSGIVYTPKETLVYENYVKMCYSDYAQQFGWLPYENQVRADDKQVVELSIKKYYAENAEVRVRLTEV